jgi:CTP synthase (UTP-ammonia lyase)
MIDSSILRYANINTIPILQLHLGLAMQTYVIQMQSYHVNHKSATLAQLESNSQREPATQSSAIWSI